MTKQRHEKAQERQLLCFLALIFLKIFNKNFFGGTFGGSRFFIMKMVTKR